MSDLIQWGFVIPVSKSKNQHTANVYSLKSINIATSKFDEADEVATSVGTSKFETSLKKQTGLLHQNLKPHCDIYKPNKPNKPNCLNPKGDDNEFLNEIISKFKEGFEEANKRLYVINDENKELSAAAKIAELYKATMNITDNQELLNQLKDYFRQVCSVKDSFLHKNLNLPYLSNNINAFNLAAKSNMSEQMKPLTDGERRFLELGRSKIERS